MEMSCDNEQKIEKLPIWKFHMPKTTKRVVTQQFSALKSYFNFHCQNFFDCFQLPACYLIHSWLTTLLLPPKSQDKTIKWTLEKVKISLVIFLGQKTSQILWLVN